MTLVARSSPSSMLPAALLNTPTPGLLPPPQRLGCRRAAAHAGGDASIFRPAHGHQAAGWSWITCCAQDSRVSTSHLSVTCEPACCRCSSTACMPGCAAHQSRCWLLQQTVSVPVTPRAAQVRRSADNAMGYAADELTKQTRDLKEVGAAWWHGVRAKLSGVAFTVALSYPGNWQTKQGRWIVRHCATHPFPGLLYAVQAFDACTRAGPGAALRPIRALPHTHPHLISCRCCCSARYLTFATRPTPSCLTTTPPTEPSTVPTAGRRGR